MQRGNIYLSIAEEQILTHLRQGAEVTEIEAIEAIVEQKRELAFMHATRGNVALARQIRMEIDEWSEDDEKDFQERERAVEALEKETKFDFG